MKLFVTSEQALPRLIDDDRHVAGVVGDEAVTLEGPHAPVLTWLARLRLLHGVPFAYLVPDDGLLRPETVRFFHLDRRWTDAVVEGALSVGTFDVRDRSALQDAYPTLRAVIDDGERRDRGHPPATSLPAANIAGMLLRSRAVSGWPGLHVAATRRDGRRHRQIRLLRMERLSPAVLLVLFEDVPDQVTVAEPSTGIQFGVQSADGGGWQVPVRDPAASDGSLLAGQDPVTVPFREGSSGVIHVAELLERLGDARGTASEHRPSASLALQLLRRPYVQPFGSDGPVGSGGDDEPGRHFQVAVQLSELQLEVERFIGGTP